MAQKHHIGIDLGTTFSSLAIVDEKHRVSALRLGGNFQMASAIYFRGPGDLVVGTEALDYAVIHPDRVARAFKRQMGEPEYGPKQRDGTKAVFEVDGRRYRPEELSAIVLKKLLGMAAKHVGPIERATISVPFVFDERRRQATRDAARIAGLKEVDLVDEPVAAAIAYGHMLVQKGGFDRVESVYLDQEVVGYDLGGGTFDATIMKLCPDGTFEVVATHGDEQLGGEDWDNVLVEMILERYRALARHDPAEEREVMQELRRKAVTAKETHSPARQVDASFTHADVEHGFTPTRTEFAKQAAPL